MRLCDPDCACESSASSSDDEGLGPALARRSAKLASIESRAGRAPTLVPIEPSKSIVSLLRDF